MHLDTDRGSAFTLLPIHHVQLAIPRGGEDACRRFWGDLLGMHELDKPAPLAARGGCWFRGGQLEIHLGVEEPFLPARKAHPGLLVDGLHQLAQRLERAGYSVIWDEEFPGHDRFYAADPFGNRLEFLQPHSALGAPIQTYRGHVIVQFPVAETDDGLGETADELDRP